MFTILIKITKTFYFYIDTIIQKSVVPYVYEIIEKVNGQSVYYHWYKMNEQEREEFVKELVVVLKRVHSKEYQAYDWSSSIKERVLSSFNQTIDMFSEDERTIILESLEKYDEILSDNKFCLIHNDLHFDNILLDNNSIKLIDFNDSQVAPFDFELRLLYMSVLLPWKWANSEMDPLQIPEDYQNLFEYIKRYYTELNDVKYLEERMTIYWVLDDFELLPRFRSNKGKERILINCQKILDDFKQTKNLK
ncbi:MAG: phosphotransferase [Bacilli bacterium]|nr:phosphotransferase [Bacilli bacterium]